MTNGRAHRTDTWLVTGGSRGIGRAIALHAARKGANVAFCARQLGDDAMWVKREIEQHGGRPLAVAADVRREDEVQHLFDATLEAFGGVDTVVCNAGTSQARLLVHATAADWDAVIGTNLGGAFLTAREALRSFRRLGTAGRIVLIGSVMQHGAPSNAVYAASKGGLVGLLDVLAQRSGVSGVQASMAVVGYVATALTRDLTGDARQRLVDSCPLRRLAEADEVAEAVWFLANAGAAAFHGRALHISGGLREVPA